MLVRCGVTVRQIAATCLPAISVAAVTKWWRQAGRGNERLLCSKRPRKPKAILMEHDTWKKNLLSWNSIHFHWWLPKKHSFLTRILNHSGCGLPLEVFGPEFPRSILQALCVGLFSSTLSSLVRNDDLTTKSARVGSWNSGGICPVLSCDDALATLGMDEIWPLGSNHQETTAPYSGTFLTLCLQTGTGWKWAHTHP